jgi:hypothetical protein
MAPETSPETQVVPTAAPAPTQDQPILTVSAPVQEPVAVVPASPDPVPVVVVSPAPVVTVTTAPNTVVVVEKKVEAEAALLLKQSGSFFTTLWANILKLETKINAWISGLKGASAILLGVAGIAIAAFLELTGTLRVLVIVPAIATFLGGIGKALIDGAVYVVSGTVSVLQVLLPLILVGASVWIIVDSLKKK